MNSRGLWAESRQPALRLVGLTALVVTLTACEPAFVVEEATVAEIHQAMTEGRITAEALVKHYLDRIEAYDKQGPSINSLITVSLTALDRARTLDAALASSGLTGPLHGIPVIVKDNYDTYDLPTTNGILALKHAVPPDDAYHVARLRDAGAIILAKSNLAEFATSGAYSVSSVLPGFSRNPYDTRRVTAGSSGGTAAAIAANLGTVGLGTDTGSSIRGPSSHQALVGFRPTMGLSSRDGIAPLNGGRDVGGPMARSVEDAVRVLEVIVGYDEADTVTARSNDVRPDGYLQFLRADGLQGKRIGVLRRFFEVPDAEQTGPEPTPVEQDEGENQGNTADQDQASDQAASSTQEQQQEQQQAGDVSRPGYTRKSSLFSKRHCLIWRPQVRRSSTASTSRRWTHSGVPSPACHASGTTSTPTWRRAPERRDRPWKRSWSRETSTPGFGRHCRTQSTRSGRGHPGSTRTGTSGYK